MAKNIPYFRGVFMRDSLPSSINKCECGVVNLDSSDGDGTHWVAYYRCDNNRIYFDSYGLDPPNELKTYLGGNIFTQTYQLQNANDVICGHLCVKVLKELANGKDFKDIIHSLWVSN